MRVVVHLASIVGLSLWLGCGTSAVKVVDGAADAAGTGRSDTAVVTDGVLGVLTPEAGPVVSGTCSALPATGGTMVNVTPAQAATLHQLTLEAAAGTAFVLAPGTYLIAGSLRLEKDSMTLRSSTDRAEDVIIDAAYKVEEAIVVRASNVTLAHVTVTHAVYHAIHVSPPSEGVNVTGTQVYGVALTDNGEQFIKVNPLGTSPGYISSIDYRFGRTQRATPSIAASRGPRLDSTSTATPTRKGLPTWARTSASSARQKRGLVHPAHNAWMSTGNSLYAIPAEVET